MDQHFDTSRCILDLTHHHQTSCPAPKPEKTAHRRIEKSDLTIAETRPVQHTLATDGVGPYRWRKRRATASAEK